MKAALAAAGIMAMLAWTSGAATAAPIAVFDTGATTTWCDPAPVLGADASVCSHYTLTVNSTPPGPSTNAFINTNGANCHIAGGWLCKGACPGDGKSTWISPNTCSINNGPSNTNPSPFQYTYQTTFFLNGTSQCPGTAFITGDWAADNSDCAILLNGVEVVAGPRTGNCFFFFSPFTIDSDFRPGLNTLDFEVLNTGGPTGLRVEITDASASAAPEIDPSSSAVPMAFLGGLLMLATDRSRRKMQA